MTASTPTRDSIASGGSSSGVPALTAEQTAALPAVLDACLWQPQAAIPGLTSDSRAACAQRAFFALKGQAADGHRFVEAAATQGAPALFVSDGEAYARLCAGFSAAAARPAGLVGVFRVEPGRAVLADLAAELYRHPSRRLKLLGVTGTNGKTTVTHLLVQLLAALGQPAGIIGTLGMWRGDTEVPNERTTPEAPDLQHFLADCLADGLGHVAMEVSSIGIALERTRGLHFAAAAYTNLTQDHLDFHGSLAAYEAEKQRLFLPEQGPVPQAAVLNRDDAAACRLEARLRHDAPGVMLLPFSLQVSAPQEEAALLTVQALEPDGAGWRGTLVHGPDRAPFSLPLPGAFNVANLLAAVGLLRACGVPLAELARASSQVRGAPGRFERVPMSGGRTVIVDYAHTPDALDNLLREARKLVPAGARLRVLFGCGGDRDRGKRPQMARSAEALADAVVVTDDNPRTEDPAAIRAEIVAGLQDPARVQVIGGRREAIAALLAAGREGDVLVIAGKGHEPYQEVDGERHPFDDRVVAREVARELGGA